MSNVLFRYVAAAPLMYALYIILKCPCKRIPSCHIDRYLGSITLALGLVAIENRDILFK
jgi:hypothetical protein